MFKKTFMVIIGVIFIGILSGCSSSTAAKDVETSLNSNKIQVVVSFNPLKEFAEAVGKDKIEVTSIVPDGMEAHDFEPKAKDMEKIGRAHIFVYNGLGMESWVEDSLDAVNSKELMVVNASTGVNVITIEEEKKIKSIHEHKHNDDRGTEEADNHCEYDPHIWLSLKEAKVEAANIKDALIKADNLNKDFYEKNYTEFAGKLDGLYNEYAQKFKDISDKHFVTGHAAFAYLCRDFGLEQNSVEDIFAEGEPTAKKLEELIEYSKKNGIKVIFMEELASPKISETLAKEVGAKVEEIYTIESMEDGRDYIQSMRENLEKIYNSLK